MQPAVRALATSLHSLFRRIQDNDAAVLDDQVSIARVPAPTGDEAARAELMVRRLRSAGLRNVAVDAAGNVVASTHAQARNPIVLCAHLDTVFPEGTDVTVKRDSTIMRAPGIGDDCRGLAVLLSVARAMRDAEVRTTGRVLFVGTVGEEGPGNLRGVRHLFAESLKDSVDYFISVDGTGFDVVNAAVGSNRYKVSFKGPGGHSYGAFGMPNPAHALGRAVAAIADLQVPSSPRTTFSVSVLSGGTSVNSIPFDVAFEIDMRSEQPAALAELDGKVMNAIHAAVAAEKARWPRSNLDSPR